MITYTLSHQKNIRDLASYTGYKGRKIKKGRLFRGGAFYRVNEEDITILNSLNLTDVVDFRGNEEFIYNPDYHLKGVNYHNFPAIQEKIKPEDRHNEDGNLLWFVEKGKTGFEHLKNQYRDLISHPKSQEAYRNFFKIVQSDNKVIYYHCSQGKDRAGLASFFIEYALGVDMETMIEDYLYTNKAMEERIISVTKGVENKSFFSEQYRQNIVDVFSAKLEYLYAALDEINTNFGGLDKYLKKNLGINFRRMRKLYLEKK